MGWSVSGLVHSVVSAPLALAESVAGSATSGVVTVAKDVGKIGGAAVGAVGSIVKPVVGVVSEVGSIVPALTTQLGPALQNLRPPAAGVVAAPTSNLPLYLGAGAAGLVLLLLLTGKKKPAAPTPTTPAAT